MLLVSTYLNILKHIQYGRFKLSFEREYPREIGLTRIATVRLKLLAEMLDPSEGWSVASPFHLYNLGGTPP